MLLKREKKKCTPAYVSMTTGFITMIRSVLRSSHWGVDRVSIAQTKNDGLSSRIFFCMVREYIRNAFYILYIYIRRLFMGVVTANKEEHHPIVREAKNKNKIKRYSSLEVASNINTRGTGSLRIFYRYHPRAFVLF